MSPRIAGQTLYLSNPPYMFIFALKDIEYGRGMSDDNGSSYFHG